MAKILEDILPQPPREYNQAQFNQLIKKLQLILNVDIQTSIEADEEEAINFFLNG